MPRTRSKGQVQRDMKGSRLSEGLITVSDPSNAASEAYRALRSRLLLHAMGDNQSKVILVTSYGSAEGKSTVCANLSVVLAQAGENTLIVDCDFRAPVIGDIFGLSGAQGLTDVLSGAHVLREVCREPLPGLKVLPAGAVASDPELLPDVRKLEGVLADARKEFDYVLLDSSPLGMVSDSALLAAQADGVLLTLDTNKTRREDLQRAMRGLREAGANVLGTVINNAR